ncbi:unnamed protein product [Triticum turgidum subsp. durum]|uniref:Uncharacterized protein n=1 Tax=Triticum turgidum subsp. durum TaxID=4567 RepID=A0A9R1RJ69_TRITD|nr:unnamed protein product [Triticum turgidum subsp. durum]
MEHRRAVGKSAVLQQSIFGHRSIAGAAVEHRRAAEGSLCWCCDGALSSRRRIIGASTSRRRIVRALSVLRWSIAELPEDRRSIAETLEDRRCYSGASPGRRSIAEASLALQ